VKYRIQDVREKVRKSWDFSAEIFDQEQRNARSTGFVWNALLSANYRTEAIGIVKEERRKKSSRFPVGIRVKICSRSYERGMTERSIQMYGTGL